MMRLVGLAFALLSATALGGCSLLAGPPPPKTIPAHSWTPYNEGLGVDIVGLAVHPTDLDRIVIQTAVAIYNTTTGGTAPWELAKGVPVDASSTWPNLVPNAISIDPKDPNRLYTVVLSGAYRSVDFGMNWTSITGSYPNWLKTYLYLPPHCGFLVAGVRPHPTAADTLFAGTIVSGGEGGVLRSTNDGVTWSPIAFTCDMPCPASVVSARRRMPWDAWTAIRPQRSRSCQPIGSVLDNDVWPIVIHPTQPSIMVAGGPYPNEVGRSTDGGKSWTLLPAPVKGEKIRTIAVNPQAPENWIISGTRTFRSTNAGASWTYDASDPVLVEVQYDQYGNVWGHDGGSVLWLRHDNNQWERIPFGGDAGIAALVVRWASGAPVLFAATSGDGLWIKRGGVKWTPIPLAGVGTAFTLGAIRPTRAGDGHVLMPESGAIRVRLQSDTNWRPLTPVVIGPQDVDFTAGLAEVCYAGGEVACWKPGEANWTPLPHGLGTTRGFLSVRYDVASDDRLFVIAGLASATDEHALLRFSRGRGGFVLDWTLPLPKSLVAYRLTLHPKTPGSLHLALWDRVIRVDGIDGGTPKWVDLGPFAPTPNNLLWITAIHINSNDPQELFVVDADGQRLFHKAGAAPWKELTPFSLSQGGATMAFDVGELAIDWPTVGRMMAVSGRGGALQELQPDGTWAVGTLKVRDSVGSAWRGVDYSGVPSETTATSLFFLPWAPPDAAILATYDRGVYVRDISRR